MFSGFKQAFGIVDVKQTEKEIIIEGIPAQVMSRDITKIWSTSRINTYMFSFIGKNKLVIPHFFAPDFLYILEKIPGYRYHYTNKKTIEKIKEKLLANTWLGDTKLDKPTKVDLNKLSLFHLQPLDYQMEFLKTYDQRTQQFRLNGYLLAAAPGAGKTYTSLVLAEINNRKKIVIISPKNAVHRVWVSEINKHYKQPPTHWVFADGKKYNNEDIAIFHFEALSEALKLVEELKTDNTFVILDESHNLNELSSQRTLFFIDLIRLLNTKNVLWQSGTAIKSMGYEVIPLLRTIDPFFTADAEARFKAIYGKDGARGLDILQHRMGFISFKVEKHQLGLDKPNMKELRVVIPNGRDYTLDTIREKMRAFITERFKYYRERRKEDEVFYKKCTDVFEKTIKNKQEKENFKQYQQHVTFLSKLDDYRSFSDIIKWVNQFELKTIIPRLPKELVNGFKDVRSVIKYTPLKIQGEALGRVLGRERIACHVAMIPFIDFETIINSTTKKTVVFTSFVEALETTKKHCQNIGLNPLVVYGKTNNELAGIVGKFETDETLNPLIATYHSLSTAVPLVMADTMIMLNAPFRAYIHEQAISRIHRLGADTQVSVWEVKLDTGEKPNISTRSSDILAWSQQMVEAIMGIKSPYMEVDETITMESSDGKMDIDCLQYVEKQFANYGIKI